MLLNVSMLACAFLLLIFFFLIDKSGFGAFLGKNIVPRFYFLKLIKKSGAGCNYKNLSPFKALCLPLNSEHSGWTSKRNTVSLCPGQLLPSAALENIGMTFKFNYLKCWTGISSD